MEEESKFYFLVALGGNLLWAATCFLDPAAPGQVVLIKLMSGLGAAIGSVNR
jgi:hypothetical protein